MQRDKTLEEIEAIKRSADHPAFIAAVLSIAMTATLLLLAAAIFFHDYFHN
jgi:hypothetical protein